MAVEIAARRLSGAEEWREGHRLICGCYGAPSWICPSLLMEQRAEGGRETELLVPSSPLPSVSLWSRCMVGSRGREPGYWIRVGGKSDVPGLRGFAARGHTERGGSKEYWNGLPLPTPGDVRTPGIEQASPVSPALAGRFFTTMPPGKPLSKHSS